MAVPKRSQTMKRQMYTSIKTTEGKQTIKHESKMSEEEKKEEFLKLLSKLKKKD